MKLLIRAQTIQSQGRKMSEDRKATLLTRVLNDTFRHDANDV